MNWLLRCVTLLLLAVTPRVAGALPGEVERFALVVGNNRAETKANADLRYADDDAVATHRLLGDAGVVSRLLVNLDDDSRRMYDGVRIDGAPSAQRIESTFAELVSRMREARARGNAVEFLFFYSGHGDVDRGEGFVVLADGRLTRTSLFALLSRSPASKNHVFVDACKSYFLAFDRGPGGRRRPYVGNALAQKVPAQLDNTGFVLSTSSDRDSHEWERYQGGILSHELRSALRGAADTDLNAGISYAEIGAFLTTANYGIRNPRFRPDFMVRPPANDFSREVLKWKRAPAPLSFAHKTWGHFYVETASGDRLLDAHPAPDQPLQLWVPEQRPLFVRRNDGRAEYVITSHEPVQVAELTPSLPQTASRGALNLALEQIFTVPFAAGDVRRFERAPPAYDTGAEPVRASSSRSTIRTVSGVTAITAASAGLVLNAISGATYLSAEDESQRETQQLNDRIRTLNRASLGCYVGAALATGVWALANWWPEGSVGVAPTDSAKVGDGFTLDVRGRF